MFGLSAVLAFALVGALMAGGCARSGSGGTFSPGKFLANYFAGLYGYHAQIDPSPPYYPYLHREADCSLTRIVFDSNGTLVTTSANYQDYLHLLAKSSTVADVYPNGCPDKTLGIASQVTAVVGKSALGTAVAVLNSSGVFVARYSSAGVLVSTANYQTVPAGNPDATPAGIAVADLNGDGSLDMVVVTLGLSGANPSSVSVFLGKGDGTFQAPTTLSIPFSADSVTIDDLNGDNKPDLLVMGPASSVSSVAMTVLLGNGDGTFQAGKPGPPGVGGNAAVTADFNGDGIKDIATSSGEILLGKGDGTFTALDTTVFPAAVANSALGIAAADFNHDNHTDLAFTNIVALTIDVYYGNGDGTFTYGASYPAPFGAQSLQAMDLDGDGFADLFVGTAGGGMFGPDANTNSSFMTLLNDGSGTFGESRAYLPAGFFAGIRDQSGLFAVADFTGDGKPDIVMADISGSSPVLSVLAGNGDGTFHTPGSTTPISGGVAGVLASADFNGDGKQDVVFGQPGATLSVAFGTGAGTFQPQANYPVAGPVTSLVVADFNGDGKPDIAFLATPTSNPATVGLYLMLNKGNGTFSAATPIDAEANLAYLAAADVNGDGRIDIVATAPPTFGSSTAGKTYLYLASGAGTFSAPAVLATGAFYPGPVAIADVNGDRHPDILIGSTQANEGTGNLIVLLGNGNGTFQAPLAAPDNPVAFPSAIAVGDVNKDGKPDVILGGCCGAVASYLMLGNGDGTFPTARSTSLLNLQSVPALALADVNGDGFPDVIATFNGNFITSIVEVLLNEGAAPASYSGTQLTLSSMSIGNATYTGVVLTVGKIIGAPSGSSANSGMDSYNPASNELTVPVVRVAGNTYYNALVTVAGLVSVEGVTGADSYDGNDLTISSVAVEGGASYQDVVVTVAGIVKVAGGMPTSAEDSYDPASGQLAIPAVVFNGKVYTNVTVTVGSIVSVGAAAGASRGTARRP